MRVDGPAGVHADQLMLFGQFVGSVQLRWSGSDADGRPVDGGIVLLSDEDEPQLRWRFTDIGPRSFRWRAESSHDGGATWEFDEEMLATRVASPDP